MSLSIYNIALTGAVAVPSPRLMVYGATRSHRLRVPAADDFNRPDALGGRSAPTACSFVLDEWIVRSAGLLGALLERICTFMPYIAVHSKHAEEDADRE